MATLKDIWDYPNNPAQGMVDDTANWSDTNAFGVSQRVEALRSGAYRVWPVAAISPATLGHSTLDLSKKIAAYVHYMDSHGDDTNLTFNQITKYPLVEWQPVPLETYPKINRIEVKVDSTTKKGVVKITTTIEPTLSGSGLANGNSIFFKYLKDSGKKLYSRLNVESGTTYWPGSAPLGVVKRIDATNYELWEAGLGSPKEIEGIVNNQDDAYAIKFTEGNNETLLCFDNNIEQFESGDTLTLAEGFANGYSLAGGEGTKYFLTKIAENRFSLFTNEARTTGAVLSGEANFSKTKTVQTTSNATHTLENLNVSGGGFSALRAELAAQPMDSGLNGWCRVQAVASGGASISFPGKNIPTTTTTDEYFGYNYDATGGSEHIDIYEDTGGATPLTGGLLQFTQTGGGTIDITITFISFLNHNQDGGNFVATDLQTGVVNSWANGDASWIEGLNSHAEFCKIWIPGMEKYTFQNTSNVTTAGAQIDFTKRWREGSTLIAANEMNAQPIATVNVDASGHLTGLTITNEGTFPTSTATNPPRVHVITAKTDTYVPPTPYAPDVFDTDDEWDSLGFTTTEKIWPTTVRPNGFKLTNSMPSSVSRSQNGTKYVRSSGVIRSQLEVSYPPMTYNQFREYEVCVEAARGQTTPFFLRCRWPDDDHVSGPTVLEDLIFQRTDSDNASLPGLLRTRNPIAIGDKVLTMEGFAAGATNAFIRGETVIFDDGGGNGFLVKIVNNTNSNIFGEAKIRIPLGSRKAIAVGESLNKNPFHVVVTLAEDDLEFTIGTDGLYRLSVVFDFDEFK